MLFVLILGIFEGGRYVLFLETLNHATREGARYAIVNGEHVACPSGPLQPPEVNTCDPTGDNVKARVEETAAGLATMGDLVVFDPVWTAHGYSPPTRADCCSGPAWNNGYNVRGDTVTVFVDYSYDTILTNIFGSRVIPPLTISAESSLVVNY
jgi:hypothetical protein